MTEGTLHSDIEYHSTLILYYILSLFLLSSSICRGYYSTISRHEQKYILHWGIVLQYILMSVQHIK